MSSWCCGFITVSYTGGCRFKTHFFYKKCFTNSVDCTEIILGKLKWDWNTVIEIRFSVSYIFNLHRLVNCLFLHCQIRRRASPRSSGNTSFQPKINTLWNFSNSLIGVFLNSYKSLKLELGYFKDTICLPCLPGDVLHFCLLYKRLQVQIIFFTKKGRCRIYFVFDLSKYKSA